MPYLKVAGPLVPRLFGPEVLKVSEIPERLCTDDRQIFDALFSSMYPGLVRFATRLTRSRETAEDVVMEIFRKVWERRAVWRPADPGFYLYGAVRNAVATHARDRNTQQLLLDKSAEEKPGMAMDLESPEVSVEKGEWLCALARAIEALSERQQLVFTLRREQGLTNAAVALALGLSIKTVERDLTVAYKILRAALTPFR